MTQLYKKNGLVFIPAGITVEEVDGLKKENTGLKTRWQCRNKYMCKENGKVVPCYTLYDCLNCHYKYYKNPLKNIKIHYKQYKNTELKLCAKALEEDLRQSIEELVEKKTALEKRIFELEKENADLKNQIKGFENNFDYQIKVIDKYKEDLKKLRVAYIQAQVANVISGTDFESIFKSVLSGENHS